MSGILRPEECPPLFPTNDGSQICSHHAEIRALFVQLPGQLDRRHARRGGRIIAPPPHYALLSRLDGKVILFPKARKMRV